MSDQKPSGPSPDRRAEAFEAARRILGREPTPSPGPKPPASYVEVPKVEKSIEAK